MVWKQVMLFLMNLQVSSSLELCHNASVIPLTSSHQVDVSSSHIIIT